MSDIHIYKTDNIENLTDSTLCGREFAWHENNVIDVCYTGVNKVTCEECILLLFERNAKSSSGSNKCRCGAGCMYADGEDSKCDGSVSSDGGVSDYYEMHLCEYHYMELYKKGTSS